MLILLSCYLFVFLISLIFLQNEYQNENKTFCHTNTTTRERSYADQSGFTTYCELSV